MAQKEDPGLPASMKLAWKVEDRATKRGPKPGLTLDGIVAAAMTIAGESGLSAVSMSAVAKRLGFTTMSLYRYVDKKDDLLVLMQDSGFGDPPTGVRDAPDWRTGARRWAQATVDCFLRNPWLLEIPITGWPMLPQQSLWLEHFLVAMRGTSMTPAERLDTALLLSVYSMNSARLRTSLAANPANADPDLQALYARQYRELLDPKTFPEVLNAVAEDDATDDSASLDFGLERILDGIEYYMA